LADAWATALNAMGFDVALEFAKQNNLDAYFIVRTESDFEAFSSPGFDRLAM
jgi:thiamine biosynthesis lipoprotein ApbE